MRPTLRGSIVVVVSLLAFRGSSRGEDVLPAALVVPKNATKVVAKRPEWDPAQLTVRYEISEAYPAEPFLADLRRRLEAAGFSPIPEGELDARYQFSRKFRWRIHILNGSGQKGEFFNWEGQWNNRDGDVVTYWLRYNSALPEPGQEGVKPDNQTLVVSGSLHPEQVLAVSALPASLIVLPGARDVRASRGQSAMRGLRYEMSVHYAATATYPPKEVMARLTEQLEKQGWTWKEDELAAAFGRPKRGLGWNESTPTRGAEQQFVWQARWKNASGDELSYDLTQFAVPPAGQKASAPDSGLLEVRASLLTRTQLGRP